VAFTATVQHDKVPDGWAAKLVITWGLFSVSRPPGGCAFTGPHTVTCPVSATNTTTVLRVRQIPGSRVRFQLTDFSFEDSDQSDNVRLWGWRLLGLHLPIL
jgi:hypothetical protein